ncbi:MAG TPA: PQQ-binding-like beta-propeller repeat protein [Frateuria sp.]|uniref:PQQ-binding-like beta-propeller repeat protein n=1 Tax=Frateuria sp. TaxID=2211372 RepID=UPI002D80F20D|nr:PQQ-binding-like beta-propeller repeat protein [Frateuria sp.]HET6805135.1 PQQ-binding-like beta-propeller repeat protein [Frateuria sp.]
MAAKPWIIALLAAWLPLASPSSAQAAVPTVRWTFGADGALWGSPTLAGKTLYFGSDSGTVYALDVSRHVPRWTFRTGGKVRARPLLADGKLFVASDDGVLYALDQATGKPAWTLDLHSGDLCRRLPSPDNPFYDYKASSPVFADGKVFVGTAGARLYAIDATTGKPAWIAGANDMFRATPVVTDGVVYIGSWDHALYAFDAASGKALWHYDTGGIVQSTAALGAGRLVVGSRSHKLFALDPKRGKPVWIADNASGSWVESSATYAGGLFLVGSSDDLALKAYDPADGRLRWSFATGGWTWATPVLADGTVYIGAVSASPYYVPGITLQRGLFAVDARTGKARWHLPTGTIHGYVTGGVMGTPAVGRDTLYATALDGNVYAIAR